MANRIRAIDEKVKPMKLALSQINIEAVADEAGVPASTLSYDLGKVEAALPEILSVRKPGPKPKKQVAKAKEAPPSEERPAACPKCGGKVTKNGTYWVWNWLLGIVPQSVTGEELFVAHFSKLLVNPNRSCPDLQAISARFWHIGVSSQ